MPSRRVAVVAALVVAALAAPAPGRTADGPSAGPSAGTAGVTAGDLPALQAELAAVTARARELGGRLEEAAARDGGLRAAMQDLAEQEDVARERFELSVRQTYMRSGPRGLDGLRELLEPGDRVLSLAAGRSRVGSDRDVIDAVGDRSAAARALQAESDRFRAGLRVQAQQVLAEQDRARTLLASAQRLAAEQAERARLGAAQEAEQTRARVELAALAETRRQLDLVSAAVTRALAPAQTARGRRSAEIEAPLLALVEAAGSGYPQGFTPTGQVIVGSASWYGPGFVGSPTATGWPYDPERLTCAHKTLPLRTVLRVTSGSRTVSCLVNDRGPYVGDRVLDMSRAGSRALGYEGVAQVRIEVLTQTG